MRKAIAWVILISMICVSMSGAALSINKNNNKNNKNITFNNVLESPEVNTQILNDISTDLNNYLNFDKYNELSTQKNSVADVEFPWTDRPIPTGAGDFVDWVINVNFNGQYFQQEISISPLDFVRRFINNPWYFESCFFDVDQDGKDDLEVYYSIFLSQLINYQESIDEKSIRTVLRVDTADITDRTAKLEVWSELSFNIGLILTGKSKDVSKNYFTNSVSPLNNILEKLKLRLEKFNFPVIKNILTLILNKLNKNTQKTNDEPPLGVLASSDDWISMGIGVSSPAGEEIPIWFEKRFNVAKENILSPTIYEQEICQLTSKEPLALLFGFKSFKGVSNYPVIDTAFSVEFDPAIYIRMQYIPLKGYVYYNYDTASSCSKETNVTFSARLKEGIEENVKLTLIFDNTQDIASGGNWMSFDLNALGFEYKANKKFNIGVLVSSPIFSAKAKLVGVPSSINYFFDSNLEIEFIQGTKFEADVDASLNLDMNSNLDDIILYYPKLGPSEPDVEFIKISGVPKDQKFYATTHVKVVNGTQVNFLGEGSVGLDMSSDLDSITVYYPKANPADPERKFIDIPSGIPREQEIGAKFQLNLNVDDFYDQENYVYGRAYRTSSGSINQISLYGPRTTNPEPFVEITHIPSNADIDGKILWNQLKGQVSASRSDTTTVDPIIFNVDIGTFNLYNNFSIGNGETTLAGHLADPGYIYFDTQNDVMGEQLIITDTSTGNQFTIYAGKVIATDLRVDWDVDFTKEPIPIEELAVIGDLSLLQDFFVSATFQGKNLDFEGNWEIGEEGEFSIDFNQDEPIVIVVDDLMKNSTKFDVSGGVTISEDFHFDIKWNWKQGMSYDDPGYFLINEDSSAPNFDTIFLNITYTPDGYQEPQYGIEAGANNVGITLYLKWWKGQSMIIPMLWYWYDISGDFYLDLLWNGHWENIFDFT